MLVTYDTVRADHLGSYGYPLDITPTADSLAERGMVFENVWAPMGMTLPSHATMMSGVSPRVHGALENLYPMSKKVLTLAEVFTQKKYATGAFVGAAVLNQGTGIEQGFRKYGQPNLGEANGSEVTEGLLRRSAKMVNESALRWIRNLPPDHNYFLWVHYYDPHGPFDPPEEIVQKLRDEGLVEFVVDPRRHEFENEPIKANYLESLWSHYAGDVRMTDLELGQLLAKLDSAGRLKDTWIVLTSDHGEGLWEHGERGHGPTLFEEQLRVPLIIVAPDGQHAGRRFEEPIQLTDLMPTLLHAAFDERIETGPGTDLLAWIDDGSKPLNRPIFVERPHYSAKGIFSIRGQYPDRYKYGIQAAVILDGQKFVLYPDGSGELYDLALDPSEIQDIAASQPETAARLRVLLEDYLAENPTAPPGTRPEVSEERRAALEQLGYTGE
ncbi:MAG: arylsulfatase A-like enzyme [Planctomycetota bacterium]